MGTPFQIVPQDRFGGSASLPTQPTRLANFDGLLASPNQRFSGWFNGDALVSGLEPARQAFEDALKELRITTSDEEVTKWLKYPTSIGDVERAASSAKEKYEKKSGKPRIRKWLASCSSKLMHYSGVMDTLAQHHPEYVSLAWGAFKFLFIAVLNYEELLTEISKTIAKIADVLPRAELVSNLYPTQRMRLAVAQLYGKILCFVQEAMKWYKKRKIAHSVSAVFKPYELSFKPIVLEITEASRRVDHEASAASKAEIRELFLKVQQLTQISIAHFERQDIANRHLADQLTKQVGIVHQQKMIEISSTLALTSIPDAKDTLDYWRSIKERRRTQFVVSPSQIAKLQNWHESSDASPIFLVRGQGLHNTSRDFLIELVDTLHANGVPTIWALPHSSFEDEEMTPTLTDVLLSLCVQALALNTQVLNTGVNPISSYHFDSSMTDEYALKLFARCLVGISKLYIVIDMSVIYGIVGQDRFSRDKFIRGLLEILQAEASNGVKLVVAQDWATPAIKVADQGMPDKLQILIGGQGPGNSRKRGGSRLSRYSSHVSPLRSITRGKDWIYRGRI